MNATDHPPQPQQDAATLVDRLAWILAAMQALVAARFIRKPHLVALTVLMWRRLGRAVLRFERAMTRPPAPPCVPRLRKPGVTRPRALALPSGKGWLLRELGWEVAACRGHLELLLADPAMQALLAARPAAGRVVRPLCRMLGLDVPSAPTSAPASALASVVVAAMAEVGAPVAAPMLPASPADCAIIATNF